MCSASSAVSILPILLHAEASSLWLMFIISHFHKRDIGSPVAEALILFVIAILAEHEIGVLPKVDVV